MALSLLHAWVTPHGFIMLLRLRLLLDHALFQRCCCLEKRKFQHVQLIRFNFANWVGKTFDLNKKDNCRTARDVA